MNDLVVRPRRKLPEPLPVTGYLWLEPGHLRFHHRSPLPQYLKRAALFRIVADLVPLFRRMPSVHGTDLFLQVAFPALGVLIHNQNGLPVIKFHSTDGII
jgi:hypothetical protein